MKGRVLQFLKDNIVSFCLYSFFIIGINLIFASSAKFHTSGISYEGYETITYQLVIPAMISIILSSINVCSYRFNKDKVDAYYQFPISKKRFFLERFFTTFILILIVFTVSYLISVAFIAAKNYEGPQSEYQVETFLYYNYIWYVPFYFCGAYVLFVTFSISTFLCYFATCKNNGIFNVLFGLLALFVIPTAVFGVFARFNLLPELENAEDFTLSMTSTGYFYNFTPFAVNNVFADIFGPLLYNGNSILRGLDILNLVLSLVLGAGSFIYIVLKKEMPAEKAGDKGTDNNFIKVLIHVVFYFGFIMVALRTSYGIPEYDSLPIMNLVLAFLISLSYLGCLFAYFKTVKLSKTTRIIYGAYIAMTIVVEIICFNVTAISYKTVY